MKLYLRVNLKSKEQWIFRSLWTTLYTDWMLVVISVTQLGKRWFTTARLLFFLNRLGIER